MIGPLEILAGLAIMLGLMFIGFHVATTMLVVGLLGAMLHFGMPAINAVGEQLWAAGEDYLLLSIPLYILLGEILMRGGATDKMYQSLGQWLNRMPGGLLHTNIGASALFSAVSGSSVATAATISTVALPAFRNRKYDQRMVLGTIAAGASLGNLIPPGVAFIIYGSMTNTSAARLYMAGILPGAIMTVLFLLTILAICVWRPSVAGTREARTPLMEKLRHSVHLLGPLAVFAVVMGGIYTGWATVTESAALGVIVCLPIAAGYRKLNIAMLHECFRSTMRLTAMTALILVAALYLNFVLSMLGVPQALANLIKSAEVSPIMLLWMLAVLYLVLGIALETMPMLVGTLPVVFPIIQAAGIDPVFFGVFMVLMCEISLISPPIGMTLYVIQGVRGEGSINDVFQGTLPFFAAMIVMTAILIHNPSIATYLPNLMFGK
ncbi:TRAP transporter large permease [Variovorax saccharolyticus]|uniref:TRAP transporter large permease n=1 Tax=Variovorax saccharolyticus TaxID=3053516 RepID=UPI0025783E90|nr:TRAP transporter large permease [Variovorax sp. J22R187]MDM0018699.1 TRAP transporter large permease [Variovorax sp. J22R187]